MAQLNPSRILPKDMCIPHKVIRMSGSSTTELAVLLFVMSRTHPASSANDKIVQMWDILLRFPEDNAVQLAITVKRLQKKGLLEGAPHINVDIAKLMEQIYNIKVSE